MKFYFTMVGIILTDILLGVALANIFKPAPGTHELAVFRMVFFLPILLVCLLQIIKLFLNVINGYVISVSGVKFYKANINDSPFSFFFGIALELCIWGIGGLSIIQFLMHS
jgi:hypothetical protein